MCRWLGDAYSAGCAELGVFVGVVVVCLCGAVCFAAGAGEFLSGDVGADLVGCGW